MIMDAQGKRVFDPEKAADVPYTELWLRGVRISSRYGKGHEYETMCRVVIWLPARVAQRLSSLFCDSKAGAVYSVDGNLTQDDLDLIGQLFLKIDGGYNGIFGPGALYLDPDWGKEPF